MENLSDEIQARQAESASRVVKFTTKSTGLAIRYALQRTLENLKLRPTKAKCGEVKIEELQYSGAEIKIIDLHKSDYKEFAWQAVKFGMPYAIAEDSKDKTAILYKGNDIDRMERVLGNVLEKAKEQKQPQKTVREKVKEYSKNTINHELGRMISKLKGKNGIER